MEVILLAEPIRHMCEFDWVFWVAGIIALLVALIPLVTSKDVDEKGCIVSVVIWFIAFVLLTLVLISGCRFIFFIWHAIQSGFLTIWPFIESNLIFIIFKTQLFHVTYNQNFFSFTFNFHK